MTISYKKLGKGHAGGDYYLDAASADDYYLNDGLSEDPDAQREPPGKFFDPAGSLIDFGIENGEKVTTERFRSLLGGFNPISGVELVKGAGESHVSGYDFTFSAPKSVSAIWSQLDPDRRAKIEAAQEFAVRKALEFFSLHAGISRKGAGGAIKEKISLVAALWPHGSSRENDPQLHTHSTVFNLAKCADQKWRTIDVDQMLKWQTAAAGIYHAALAEGLDRELGIQCAVKEGEFVFSAGGVSETVGEHWSKRSQKIKEALANKPADAITKAVIDKATVESRDKKSELTRAELFERWEAEGKEIGFTRREAEACLGQGRVQPLTEEEVRELALLAAKNLTQSTSVFNEANVFAMLGVLLQGRGTAEDVENGANWVILNHLIELGVSPDGHRVFSTPEMVDLEKKMMEDAKTENPNHVQDAALVEAAIREKSGISDEQADAVRHACLSPNMVSIVEGAAGAGKSYTMEAVKSVYASAGYEIHGLALSWSAAGVLSEEAKIEFTRAVEGFVRDLQIGKIALHEKSVLILDEAGLVGSRHMAAILDAAREAGAKVIPTGDSKQLSPVEAGGPLEAMVEEIGSARIDEIRRQGGHVRHDPDEFAKFQWMRDAVSEFADGRAEEALSRYEAAGLVHLEDDHESAILKMIEEWNRDRLGGGGTSLLLANDNETVRELNTHVREILRGEGKIGEDAIVLKTTDLKKSFDLPFAVGDQIMFRKNDKEMGIAGDPARKGAPEKGVFNRTGGTITAITPGENGAHPKIKIQIEGKGEVEIVAGPGGYWDPKTKGTPIQHAYATTIYASQGMTVDRTYLLDSRKIDRRLAYVGMSRHREKCTTFVDRESVHQSMMEKLGSDEWRPLVKVEDAELLGHVKKTWGRASRKLTTTQWLKESEKFSSEKQQEFEKTMSALDRAEQKESSMKNQSMTRNFVKKGEAEKLAESRAWQDAVARAKGCDLPAELEKLGVKLKKNGTNEFKVHTGADEADRLFRSSRDGHWLAHTPGGDREFVDSIDYLRRHTGAGYRETVLMLAGDPQSASLAAMQLAAQPAKTPAQKAIHLTVANQVQRQQAADYARSRGISTETLREAHKQGMLALDQGGVVFVGRKPNGEIGSAETRLLNPRLVDGEAVTKWSYAGSDKTFPPILRGDEKNVHLVEGGFDALALRDLHIKEGVEPPTIVVTGGAKTRKWENNEQVRNLIGRAEKVTAWQDNELFPDGTPDLEKQAKTLADHDKQAESIVKIRGGADGFERLSPPKGVKDLAELNKKTQADNQQKIVQEEERHGLRM